MCKVTVRRVSILAAQWGRNNYVPKILSSLLIRRPCEGEGAAIRRSQLEPIPLAVEHEGCFFTYFVSNVAVVSEALLL